MSTPSTARATDRAELSAIACVAAGVALSAGVVVLCGWAFKADALIRLKSGWASCKPWTATSIVLVSVTLLLSAQQGSPKRLLRLWLIGLTTLIALVNLTIAGGHDGANWLAGPFGAAVARGGEHQAMSRMTATAVFAFAIALFSRERGRLLIAQRLVLIPSIVSYLSIAGYVFGVRALYSLPGFGSVSLITALLLVLLSFALLLETRAQGFVRTITSQDAGGYIARRLLPLTLGLPILIEAVREFIAQWQPQAASAVAVSAYAGVGTALLLQACRRIGHYDRARQAASLRLERANEALRQDDRRKDEFLATLAHELRNPLSPIRTAAMVLNRESSLPSQREWATAVIERQVENMARLLDDLLDISRLTQGMLKLQREALTVESLVASALELARPAIDARRHRLEIEVMDGSAGLDGDPVRLAQVLVNLLSNAAKYTEAGGWISLSTATVQDKVLISVKDSGIGIESRFLEGIFGMFSQVRSALERSEGGLGIGLALVRGVVELHGGSVTARSGGPGKGSEFLISLPLVKEAAAPAPRDTSLCGIASRRIVIADDNRDAAASMAMLLELEGHEVHLAYDGEEALELIQTSHPELAILDIGMPKLNGYEVAQAIRRSSACDSTRLVALTGWAQEQDKQRAYASGFDAHLAKPAAPERIRAVLAL